MEICSGRGQERIGAAGAEMELHFRAMGAMAISKSYKVNSGSFRCLVCWIVH